MKKVIFYLSIIILLGCQNNIQKKIVHKITRQCKDAHTCILKIRDVTDFEWDRMYIFNESVRLEEVNKILGFKYDYFEDIARRIIFTKGNKVVNHEDDFPYPKEKPNGKVFFKFGNDSLKYAIFSPDKAIFKVQKNEIECSIFYNLTPLE
jgi:hypothetical protein